MITVKLSSISTAIIVPGFIYSSVNVLQIVVTMTTRSSSIFLQNDKNVEDLHDFFIKKHHF